MRVVFVLCAFFVTCTHQSRLERDFFKIPRAYRVERLRQYSLEDQYRLYRYGHDHIEPPDFGLAKPIVERGVKAIPFLTEQLNSSKDDLAVRDILYLLEQMRWMKTFDARKDPALIQLLKDRVFAMKPSNVQYSSRETFEYLTDTAPKP